MSFQLEHREEWLRGALGPELKEMPDARLDDHEALHKLHELVVLEFLERTDQKQAEWLRRLLDGISDASFKEEGFETSPPKDGGERQPPQTDGFDAERSFAERRGGLKDTYETKPRIIKSSQVTLNNY